MLRYLRRFWRDERGAGTVFMVMMLPLFLGVAGLAVDAASAYRTRNILQGAADAASLAATLALPDTKAATAAAVNYAKLNLPNNGTVLAAADVESGNWNVTTQAFTKDGTPVNAVRVTTRMTEANGNALPTTLLNIIGIDHWDITAQSIAAAEQPKLWVSLVLDNTGSMCASDTNRNATGPCPSPSSTSKITSLKAATHDLLDMLRGASTVAGDVQVAIVPFVKDVNVGTANVNAAWLDWTDWNAINGSCNVSGRTDKATCEAVGIWTTAHCSITRWTTQGSCQSHNGTWYASGCSISSRTTQSSCTTKGVWTPKAHSTWTGCVMDRGLSSGPSNDYDALNTTPVAGQNASLFPPEQYSTCPQSVMGLSYNWTALGSKVDAMTANGGTNQTVGLVWGWHAMSQGNPLNAPLLPKGTQRVIILLSDGLNTQDRWYGNGSTQSSAVDARMELACTNAKADGIQIYTVYVDLAGAQGNSTVLQNCASDAKKYYDLKSTGDIKTAFADIGRQIIRMRLVH